MPTSKSKNIYPDIPSGTIEITSHDETNRSDISFTMSFNTDDLNIYQAKVNTVISFDAGNQNQMHITLPTGTIKELYNRLTKILHKG